MEDQILITIVIPNYNGESLIDRCILELWSSMIVLTNRLGKIVEVVVVDDCSTDRSCDMLRERFPWINVLALSENVGFAGACHQGAKMARGEYLLFLNNDAWPDHHALVNAIDYIHNNPEYSVFSLKIVNSDGSFQGGPAGLDWLGFPGTPRNNEMPFFAFGAAFIVKTSEYFNVEGFDESYFAFSEEVDLCWRLQLRGSLIGYCESAVFYHLGGQSFGEGGRLSNINFRRFFLGRRNELTTLLKNYSAYTLPGILFLWIIETIMESALSLIFTKNSAVVRANVLAVVSVIRNRKDWMEKRRAIQSSRNISDRLIIQRMLPPFERTRLVVRWSIEAIRVRMAKVSSSEWD